MTCPYCANARLTTSQINVETFEMKKILWFSLMNIYSASGPGKSTENQREKEASCVERDRKLRVKRQKKKKKNQYIRK